MLLADQSFASLVLLVGAPLVRMLVLNVLQCGNYETKGRCELSRREERVEVRCLHLWAQVAARNAMDLGGVVERPAQVHLGVRHESWGILPPGKGSFVEHDDRHTRHCVGILETFWPTMLPASPCPNQTGRHSTGQGS